MSIQNFRSARKLAEWCGNTKQLLLWLAREMEYHSASVADVQLDFYHRKECGELEILTLIKLHKELSQALMSREMKSFDTLTKYWVVLNLVLDSYQGGYPPKYKEYIN